MIIDCTNVENPYEYVAYILKEEITKKEGCRCPGTYIVNIETDACGCCNTVMDWGTDDSTIWSDDWWEGGPIVKIHGYIEICEVAVPNNLSNDESIERNEHDHSDISERMTDDKTAGICTSFLNGEGRCFLKGSFCDHPFDSEFNTCRKHMGLDNYCAEPHHDSEYKYMAPAEIRRAYGIDAGDIIADYFVPYSEIEKFKDPSMPIRQAREIVHDKLDQKGYRIAYGDMIVYRNCKIKLGNAEETGVYVCAKGELKNDRI